MNAIVRPRGAALRWRALGIAVVAMSLCACTFLRPTETQSPPPAASPEQLRLWNERRIALERIDAWRVKGRMAVRTKDESGSATVRWHRHQTKDDLDIYGPFGSGHVRINAAANSATLTDSKRGVRHAENIRELLYQAAGWPIPFDALKYWIVGLPVPDVAIEWQLDDKGRIAWLRQSGWLITIKDYRLVDGIALPKRLRVEALPGTTNLIFPDGRESDSLVVKLVVQEFLRDPDRS